MRTKILFSVLAVALATLFPLVQAEDLKVTDRPEPSMVLYLSFDEGSGKTAEDVSIYSNHGQLKGDPKGVKGKFGNALKFNGKTDWVEVAHHDSLTVDSEVTVMAWIKAERYTDPSTQWQGIVAKSNSPRSYSFYTTSGGGGALHFSAAGGSTSKKIKLNEWQHVVAQVKDEKHLYYINGEDGGGGASGVKLPGKKDTATVVVGKSHEATREFLGLIDEVRIWNRALSQKEVQFHMNAGKNKVSVEPNGKLTTSWGNLKTR